MAALLYLIILPAAYSNKPQYCICSREHDNIISRRILAPQFICKVLFIDIVSILQGNSFHLISHISETRFGLTKQDSRAIASTLYSMVCIAQQAKWEDRS